MISQDQNTRMGVQSGSQACYFGNIFYKISAKMRRTLVLFLKLNKIQSVKGIYYIREPNVKFPCPKTKDTIAL